MNAAPKFITDASGGGLARWLILLGFDTSIYTGEAGRPMMRQAQMEGRIILTRRRDMMERQFSGQMLLIPGAAVGAQLHFVTNSLSLKIDPQKMYTLCLRCNERLEPIVKESIRHLVPQYVFENCSHFNQCEKCRKIYWQGTHERNARRFLEHHQIKLTP